MKDIEDRGSGGYGTKLQHLTAENDRKKISSLHQDGLTHRQKDVVSSLRNQAPRVERFVNNLLQQTDIPYTFQRVIAIPLSGFYVVDFYFPNTKTCLELDGEYHNGTLRKVKDSIRDKAICGYGFRMIRLKDDEAWKITTDRLYEIGLGRVAEYRESARLKEFKYFVESMNW